MESPFLRFLTNINLTMSLKHSSLFQIVRCQLIKLSGYFWTHFWLPAFSSSWTEKNFKNAFPKPNICQIIRPWSAFKIFFHQIQSEPNNWTYKFLIRNPYPISWISPPYQQVLNCSVCTDWSDVHRSRLDFFSWFRNSNAHTHVLFAHWTEVYPGTSWLFSQRPPNSAKNSIQKPKKNCV